jgi:hypothetical protein
MAGRRSLTPLKSHFGQINESFMRHDCVSIETLPFFRLRWRSFDFARFKGLADLASTCSTCQHQLSPPVIGSDRPAFARFEGLAICAGRLGAEQGAMICRRATETVAVAELDFAGLEPRFPPPSTG